MSGTNVYRKCVVGALPRITSIEDGVLVSWDETSVGISFGDEGCEATNSQAGQS